MTSCITGRCDGCMGKPYRCRGAEHISPTTVRFLRCDVCKNGSTSCTQVLESHQSHETVKYYYVSANGYIQLGPCHIPVPVPVPVPGASDEAPRFMLVAPTSCRSSSSVEDDSGTLPNLTIADLVSSLKFPPYIGDVPLQDVVDQSAATVHKLQVLENELNDLKEKKSAMPDHAQDKESIVPDLVSGITHAKEECGCGKQQPHSRPTADVAKTNQSSKTNVDESEEEDSSDSCTDAAACVLILLVGFICGALLVSFGHCELHHASLGTAREIISNLTNEMQYCNITTVAVQSETSFVPSSPYGLFKPIFECVIAALTGIMVIVIVICEITSKRRVRFEEQLRSFEKQSLSSLINFFKSKKYVKRIRGEAFLSWLDSLSHTELENMNSAIATCGAKLPDHLFEDYDIAGISRKCDMWKLWDGYSVEQYPGTVQTLQCALLQMAESGLPVPPLLQKV